MSVPIYAFSCMLPEDLMICKTREALNMLIVYHKYTHTGTSWFCMPFCMRANVHTACTCQCVSVYNFYKFSFYI